MAGELLIPEAELRELIDLQSGDTFSRTQVTENSQRLLDRFGNDGYALANVNTLPTLDDGAQQVDLTFVIDPGSRVYVRRINFSGNLKTQDEVLRREMRQIEGSWFSKKDIDRSTTRLQRLDYLASVELETRPVPGTTDQLDLNYTVTERPAGSFVLGLGYGQEAGVLFNSSISQKNFLGTGNEVDLAFSSSATQTIYSISFNDPYYTLDGISRGFRVTYEETDVGETNAADYVVDGLTGESVFRLSCQRI